MGYMKEIGGTSFVALYASFHSKTENVQFKVTDAKSAVDLAKKLGIAALVTKDEVTVTHVVDAELLQAYLKAHPEHADEFAPYVQLPTIKMSRWAKPTTALTETFGTRLTNKSVSLTS